MANWGLDEIGHTAGVEIKRNERTRTVYAEQNTFTGLPECSTFVMLTDEDSNEVVSVHLTPDEAEAMATVLLYTAAQHRQRKEARDAEQ